MPFNRQKVAVLASGGLDSAALLWKFAPSRNRRYDVFPIFIRQGLRWELAELHALKSFLRDLPCRPLTVLSFPVQAIYGNHWAIQKKPVPGRRSPDAAVYLPGRNLMLSLKAALFCASKNIPEIAIGSLDHNPFPDATPRFFRRWSAAIAQGLGKPISISAPFRHLEKSQVIREFSDAPLWKSFSCLAPRGFRHCGRCNKCAERQKAFRAAGVEDQTVYVRS